MIERRSLLKSIFAACLVPFWRLLPQDPTPRRPRAGRVYAWTGAVDRNWNNPGNWRPVGVPGEDDYVLITSARPIKPGSFATLTHRWTDADEVEFFGEAVEAARYGH